MQRGLPRVKEAFETGFPSLKTQGTKGAIAILIRSDRGSKYGTHKGREWHIATRVLCEQSLFIGRIVIPRYGEAHPLLNDCFQKVKALFSSLMLWDG